MPIGIGIFGLLILMSAGFVPQADAQNRGGGGNTYRPPAPPPPQPVRREAQPGGYASPVYGGRGAQAPARPYSPGSPVVRDAFRGPVGQSATAGTQKPAGTGFGGSVKDQVGSGSRAAGGSSGLRDKFGTAAGAPPAAAKNASAGSGFGSAVKDQVGSGTSAAGASSGLRDKFRTAASGDGKPPGGGGGGGAVAAPGGGPSPSGGPGQSLTTKFNVAASGGAGRIDGRQDPGMRPRPNPRDAFGQAAMQAEKEQGRIGAQRRGAAIHEKALRQARKASEQKPKPATPTM